MLNDIVRRVTCVYVMCLVARARAKISNYPRSCNVEKRLAIDTSRVASSHLDERKYASIVYNFTICGSQNMCDRGSQGGRKGALENVATMART